jgi:cytochrome P450
MERVDFFNSQPVMNYSDPPQHQRLRRIVSGAFSPKRVAQMSAAAASIAEDLLDGLDGQSEIEAVSQLTKPLSIRLLLNDFMGLADEHHHYFMDYITAIPLLDKVRPGEPKPKRFLDAWAAGAAYCREAVERARRDKTDDLIGLIAAANEDGDRLSDDEMMALLMTLFSGGISTMGSSGSASLVNLARHPEVGVRICETPDLAVSHYEESLRLDAPVTLVMRFAADDMEIGGRAMPKDTPIYVMIGAAGYDPQAFPEPNRFDVGRENLKDHMAFSVGLHACIGANIARATIPVLIQIMARRYPNLRLSDPDIQFEFDTTPRSRHYAAVPLAL